jgi:hypothetical protein
MPCKGRPGVAEMIGAGRFSPWAKVCKSEQFPVPAKAHAHVGTLPF